MKKAIAIATMALASVGVSQGQASETSGVRSSLMEFEQVYAPRGFQALCDTRPEFCVNRQVDSEVGQVLSTMSRMFGARSVATDAPELTPERLETLERVNKAVNASIHPTEDASGDVWSFSAHMGDCEEYVLMKREVLARLGWPRSAMRIAVVTGAGDYPYHAVLVVTTRGGDIVLDNLTDRLTMANQSPYEFVVSQSFARPGAWVRVRATR